MTTAPAPGRPTDPLSIVALAAGIGAIVLALTSVLPLLGMCLGPLSGVSALVALVTGLTSVARTTLDKGLDGRLQAIAGVFLALLWGVAAAILLSYVARH